MIEYVWCWFHYFLGNDDLVRKSATRTVVSRHQGRDVPVRLAQ
nr:uncharacterized protein CTRU02_09010 [Colletotrichum truncatum]KAF6789218.1 hypothetical protein CTRU02_09010 [Colletotrichum truncatum]